MGTINITTASGMYNSSLDFEIQHGLLALNSAIGSGQTTVAEFKC